MTPLTKALKGIYKQIRRYNNREENPHPIPAYEKHGTTADWVGIVVSLILALLTLGAIYIAYDANQTSIKSLNYTKEKDSLDNIAQAQKDRIAEEERAANRDYIDSSLAIAKQNADAVTAATEIAKITSESFFKSAAAAEQSLNENRKINEFSRDATKKEMRAYIILDSITVYSLGANMNPMVLYHFRNAGKTPANKIGFISKISFLPSADYIDGAWFKSQNSLKNIDNVIGSGEKVNYPSSTIDPITASIWNDLVIGKTEMYVSFRMRYSDVFKEQHTTNVCVEVKANGNRFGYSKYNDAD